MDEIVPTPSLPPESGDTPPNTGRWPAGRWVDSGSGPGQVIPPDAAGRWVNGTSGPRYITTPGYLAHEPLPGPVVDGGDPDEYETDPVVGAAVDALKTFSGDALTRDQAAGMLPLWRYFHELSTDEMLAATRRFPA